MLSCPQETPLNTYLHNPKDRELTEAENLAEIAQEGLGEATLP